MCGLICQQSHWLFILATDLIHAIEPKVLQFWPRSLYVQLNFFQVTNLCPERN